jgi:hypothetical protein
MAKFDSSQKANHSPQFNQGDLDKKYHVSSILVQSRWLLAHPTLARYISLVTFLFCVIVFCPTHAYVMSDFGIGTNKAFPQNGVLLEIISLLNPLLRTETRTTSSDIQWETDISEVIYI